MKSVRIRSFFGPYFLVLGLNTPYFTAASLNAGKYRPEKLRVVTLFTQCRHAYILLHILDKPLNVLI